VNARDKVGHMVEFTLYIPYTPEMIHNSLFDFSMQYFVPNGLFLYKNETRLGSKIVFIDNKDGDVVSKVMQCHGPYFVAQYCKRFL